MRMVAPGDELATANFYKCLANSTRSYPAFFAKPRQPSLTVELAWRRGRDSNSRYPYGHNALAGRPNQPLWHLSKLPELLSNPAILTFLNTIISKCQCTIELYQISTVLSTTSGVERVMILTFASRIGGI
jgi:hypothetical protein